MSGARHSLGALVAIAACLWSSSASAGEPAESHAEALAGAFFGTEGVGMFGAELEGAYFPSDHYGFGGTLAAFAVDNGADPQYSDNGTLNGGFHGLAFAEGDLLPGWITPYARLGVGLGSYERYYDGSTESELNFAAQLSGGVALRGGPLVFRLAASPTLFGSDLTMTYGAAVGARF